ncbi:hypothetical protein MMC16_002124 [Acarospora aff. strigata]|nr:hypothetical protein [Acarospora aff. strigata]
MATFVDINRHFDGGLYHNREWKSYTNPTLRDVGCDQPVPPAETFRHRDVLSRETWKPKDLLRYVSPTYGKSFRMIVQATPEAYQRAPGDWRRTKVSGTAPTVLRLSEWALQNASLAREGNVEEIFLLIGRVLVTIPLQFCILAWPFTRSRDLQNFYPAFPGRSWDYPKHARNRLDASPLAPTTVAHNGDIYQVVGDLDRLLAPRALMVKNNGRWELGSGKGRSYICISYTGSHFPPDASGKCSQVELLAEKMALEAGVDAYWLDYRCRATTQPELSEDVHRICDVFRGARQVVVVLPDQTLSLTRMREWGQRMWTLTEALLSSSQLIKFCTAEQSEERTKIELAEEIWEDHETTRLLAEHYTGLLNLSRLELITLALEALIRRQYRTPEKLQSTWTQADVAYALMALLRYRPRMDPSDTLFQALARLSLANDSDCIVERMVSMLPDPGVTHHSSFVLKDHLGANLWDIEPLCQTAGVSQDREIILDGCKAISIRWKDIPRIEYLIRTTWKKLLATVGLRSGPLWLLIGIILVAVGISAGAIVLIIGLILVIAAPWSVKLLYGGKIWGQSTWLIGIEGTMPIKEIERMTFGDEANRLSYAPSSSLLCQRENEERVGRGPDFVEKPGSPLPDLPPGHRLFTLIDTGTMTVTIFSAVRPPSVALICGREGGMLRVVLCHYERSTNCLHKETVLRMETPMLDKAVMLSWVKLA